MKVLEERLMYLFIVFCKDLLCIPNSILAQGLSFVRYIFCFPPSHTLFVLNFISGSFDLPISVFHLAFTTFDSHDAPLSGLRVIGLCFALAFLFDRYFLVDVLL